MKLLRVTQWFGGIVLILAVCVAVFSPSARPSLGSVAVLVAVAAVVGLILGLAAKRWVPLDRRLAAMHKLNPRIARRFLPDAKPRTSDDA
jgi:hypothetical protein